jgi:site-specific DNA-cytosine methylase
MRKYEIEVLPSPAEIARQPVQRAELDRLVKQQVAEILAARDEFVFEPFFRSRQVAYELKRLQTVPEQRKWKVYFERYGCLICKTQKRIHAGNGMCDRCHAYVFQTLKQIIAEGITGQPAPPAGAHKLLPAGTGVHRHWNKRRKRTTLQESEE